MNIEELKTAIKTLEQLSQDTHLLWDLSEEERKSLYIHCGKISRPTKEEREERAKEFKKVQQRKLLTEIKEKRGTTGIRSARKESIFVAPKMIEEFAHKEKVKLPYPQNCYVCKKLYSDLHFFYDSMCEDKWFVPSSL